jgi:hypothetical protein
VGGGSDGGCHCRACSPVQFTEGFYRPGPPLIHSRQWCVRTCSTRRPAFCLHSVRLRQHSFLRVFRPPTHLSANGPGGVTRRCWRGDTLLWRLVRGGSPDCAGPVTNSRPTASATPRHGGDDGSAGAAAASRPVKAIGVQCHQGLRRRPGRFITHKPAHARGATRDDLARLPGRSGKWLPPSPRGRHVRAGMATSRPPVSAQAYPAISSAMSARRPREGL